MSQAVQGERHDQENSLRQGLLAGGLFLLAVVAGWFLGGEVKPLWPAPTATRLPPPSPLPSATALPPSATPTATARPPSPTPTPPPTATPTLTPTATPWPQGQAAVIGTSVKGRPIEVYRFGQGPDQRLIIAGIHGGYEGNTVALAKALMHRLRLNPKTVPPEVTLFILPVLNVDGYTDHRGETYGRPNAHGVDLNRNFPVFWQADWDKTHCWHVLPITAGPHPFSEPETQALRDFIHWPGIHITALISYHSAAATIFAGGQPPDPRAVSLAQALAHASGYTFPPQDIGCPYTGQLIDWAVVDEHIAAVDVELTTHYDTDLEQNWRLLQAFLQWRP